MTNRPTPIIDTLFPGRRVHLIGGASGAGKTTWLMQTIEEWRRGNRIYGYTSRPVPFLYISYDRDEDDFIDTCERMQIDPATYNFISPVGSDLETPLISFLKTLCAKHPETRLYVIEALGLKTPGGKINDQMVVGIWLRSLQQFCKVNDITIIATLHAAKTKENDSYKEPRAKIAGCAAWSGYTSTVVVLEEQDSTTENSRRTLYILPRNARKHIYTLDFDKEGGMHEVVKSKPVKERLLAWLAVGAPQTFSPQEAGTAINAAPASIYIELAAIATTGLIRKIGPATYEVAKPGANN